MQIEGYLEEGYTGIQAKDITFFYITQNHSGMINLNDKWHSISIKKNKSKIEMMSSDNSNLWQNMLRKSNHNELYQN